MDNTPIQNMLSRLDYSQKWLDCGLLTESMLTEQIKELDSGDDDNTEHYRYRTLTNYLNFQSSFDDPTLRNIIELLRNDPDKSMASSATILLLKSKGLTNEQFDTVADFLITSFGHWTKKYIDMAQ